MLTLFFFCCIISLNIFLEGILMKKIIRVLTVRKHKTVTFIDAYQEFGKKIQLMVFNNLLETISLNVGDLMMVDSNETLNRRGNPINEITKIHWKIAPIVWESYKGISSTLQSPLENLRLNARNGGKQINLFLARNFFIDNIKTYLTNMGYIEIHCKSIEEKRTSAKRNPLVVASIHQSEPLYLRITMENQLKQAVSILLHSVFSLDNVYYDKGTSPNAEKEVLILELVSVNQTIEDLIKFIFELDSLLRNTFCAFNLSNYEYTLPDSLSIVDCNGKSPDDISHFQNSILLNIPVNSPFIRADANGKRMEFQWIIRGKMVGHGYDDEFNYNNLLDAVNQQMHILNLDDCNKMEYTRYGLPKTTSLGLGIDIILKYFFNIEYLVNISNPLGFDYK